ncbi:glutamyl-tRNA(Gln) amidotransferase subunit B, mitochondrial-like isoform X1 [Lytechinus variegatus]|uniref:glutamyl-tRNA(Gln) amidotransferase subunit B, mitochondrial-like isoform X1 n=1 Tax=Lytechinus variegatus TaxID=7654 RepID=UPI001BB172D0|nr:glutamyl-tRNA(Gln) amidotransferase subunit B, mitochondrial-like isoform X1 [Lytechinus variegatus]
MAACMNTFWRFSAFQKPVAISLGRSYSGWRAIKRRNYSVTTDCSSEGWSSMVGLEIHAQILSNTKLFSASKAQFMAPPNSLVSFFDASLPGTLPVLNRRCVEAGVLTALALSCSINMRSVFDRKHYFYADLPAGYQITQQRLPLAVDGRVEFTLFDERRKKPPSHRSVRIKQIQLEQDSGKSLHDEDNAETLVDLNRAGVGLMELVTEPDLTDGTDSAAMVRELQLLLQALGTCDGKMDEGSLRVDANVSVHRPGEPPGVRSEVKNINSIRFVKQAVDFEIKRHIKLLERGEKIHYETRAFDNSLGITVPMREKEGQIDYRFMAEPNLPPLILHDNTTIHRSSQPLRAINVDTLRNSLPELPRSRRQRLADQYGMPLDVAHQLLSEPGLVEYFESVLQEDSARDSKRVLNWLTTEVLRHLNLNNISVNYSPLPASSFGELIDLMQSGAISAKTGKTLTAMVFDGDTRSLTEIIEENGWGLITDEPTIRQICERIINSNTETVEEYHRGNKKAINRLMGNVQKETQGRVDPSIAIATLKQLLKPR